MFVWLLLCIIFFSSFCPCDLGALKILCPMNFLNSDSGAYENPGLILFWSPAWTWPISVGDSPSCRCQRSLPSLHISEWDPSSWESAETETREDILVDLNFFGVMQLFSSQECHIVQMLGIYTLFGTLLCYHLGRTHNFWSTILDNVARHNLGWKNTTGIDFIA